MTTVAEPIVAALAAPGRARTSGASSATRSTPSPTRSAAHEGIDWIGVRHEEAARVRRLRPGAADRHARRLHGHGRARLDPPAQRPLRRGEVPRAGAGDLRPGAARRISATTSSRRSTTTRCSPTSRSSATRSPAPSSSRACSSVPSRRALTERGVAVLTLPGDVGALGAAQETPGGALHRRTSAASIPDAGRPGRRRAGRSTPPRRSPCWSASARARPATTCSRWPSRSPAPMVLTLKAKEGLERENPFQVGQTGLIGNPAARQALDERGPAADARDRLPLPRLVSRGQGRRPGRRQRGAHIGRRTRSTLGVVGDAGLAVRALLDRVADQAGPRPSRRRARGATRLARATSWQLADPGYEHRRPIVKVRSKFDNPDGTHPPGGRWPRAWTAHAADDAIFTTDTGHVHRLAVALRRAARHAPADRLLQPRLDGQRHAAGARRPGPRPPARQVIAFCGDGGLTMLLGDLITAVSYDLPVKLVVFDNGRLGMVKLEQEQGGTARVRHRSSTTRTSPRSADAIGLHGVRVEDPADLRGGRARRARTSRARCCSTSSPTPTRSRVPPKRDGRRRLGLRDREARRRSSTATAAERWVRRPVRAAPHRSDPVPLRADGYSPHAASSISQRASAGLAPTAARRSCAAIRTSDAARRSPARRSASRRLRS